MSSEENSTSRTTKKRMLILEEISQEMDQTVAPTEQTGPSTEKSDSGKLQSEPKLPGTGRKPKFFSEVPARNSRSQISPTFKTTATAVSIAKSAFKLPPRGPPIKSITDSLLYDILKPVFILMKISGIFFSRKLDEQLICGRYRSHRPMQIYCSFMCIFLGANFIRSFFYFTGNDKFGYELFFKLMWCIFWYECASRAFLNISICWQQKNGLEDLILKLEETFFPDNIIPYEGSLRNKLWLLLLYCFTTSLCYVGICSYGFYMTDDTEGSDLFLVLLKPFPVDVITKGIFLFLTFIGAFVGSISLIFFVLICVILYKEFEYMTRTFSMKIPDDGDFVDDLERFRMNHQKRCQIVEKADGLFKVYIANAYMTEVPIVVLLMYNLLSTNQDTMHRVTGMIFFLQMLAEMVLISAACIIVNSQGHAPLEYIYRIRKQENPNPERELVMSMFLNRLTGTSIGLSAWDMFVINKPTMLTIMGLIATYFFLLVQFQNPMDSSKSCQFAMLTPNGTFLYNMPCMKTE